MTINLDFDPFTLKQRRVKLRMTQQQLGTALDCSSVTVWSWETGRTKVSLKNLGKLEALERSKRIVSVKKKKISPTMARKIAMGHIEVPTWRSHNGRKEITIEEARERVAAGKQVWSCGPMTGIRLFGVNGEFKNTGQYQLANDLSLIIPVFPNMGDDE